MNREEFFEQSLKRYREQLKILQDGDVWYLSGPMSNIAEHNYPEFMRVDTLLTADGHNIINPAKINTPSQAPWEWYLAVDLAIITDLYMKGRLGGMIILPKYESSRGVGDERYLINGVFKKPAKLFIEKEDHYSLVRL